MAQENPKEKLWKALNEGGSYTKSFDEFNSQFSTPEKIYSLWSNLSSSGFYTKSVDDFNNQFFSGSGLGKSSGVSDSGSTVTPETSVEPSQTIESPEEQPTQPSGPTLGQSLEGNIREANRIADEYGLEQGESYELENLPGYDTIVGATDAEGRLLNPLRRDQQTGELSNVIQPVEVNREQAIASNEAAEIAALTPADKAVNSIKNMWTHIQGFPSKAAILFDQNARFDASRYITWFGANQLVGKTPDEVRNDAYAELDRLNEEYRPTSGIIESVRDGSIAGLAAGIVNATTSLLSSMALGLPTAGAGTVIDIVGESVYSYNTKKAESLGVSTEELLESGRGDDIVPYITGSIASGLERAGYTGVTQAINRNLSGHAARKLGLIAFDSGKEAVTEWTQTGMGAYEEVIASGGSHLEAVEAAGRAMASEEGIENALQGMFGSLAASGGGRAIKGIVGKSAKEKASVAQNTIQQIAQDYVNNPDPVVRGALMEAAMDASDQMLEATNESKSTLEGLSDDSRAAVIEAQSQIDAVDQSLESGSLSEASTIALESRRENLETEVEQIIQQDENTKIDSQVPVEDSEVAPVGEQTEQTEGVVNGEVVADTVDTTVETEPQDQGVATQQSEVITEPVSDDPPSDTQTPTSQEIVQPVQDNTQTEQINEVQENTVQENEQTPIREEVVEENRESQEMPPVERTNPRLKELVRSLPRQDIETLRGPANVEFRRDVIESITGNRPTKRDAGITNVKSALNDYFGLGEMSPAAGSEAIANWANYERTEFSSPDEAVRYQAENTTDPDVILDLYSQESPVYDDRSTAISEYLGTGKINLRDYQSYGDVNNLDPVISRNRIDIRNTGIPLDVAAQELSDQLGYEITPEEIVDFVTDNPTQQSFIDSGRTDSQAMLEDRYRELTGRNITPRVMDSFARRQAESVTDADLVRQDPNMAELGVTPENVADRADMEASEGLSPVEAPLPKSLLKGVSDRLKSTGLANSVRVMDSSQITERLGVDGEAVNGYVDPEGNIVINSERANLDTPVHELAHVWETIVEKENPELHLRGMELIQGDEGAAYVEYVRETQPSLEGAALYKEALAQAIGDSGARIIEGQQRSVIKEWLKAVWDYIATRTGISGMTADQVSKLSLREYTDAVAVDLLSGKPYVRLENGDIVADMGVNSESQMDDRQKFMSDFIMRMKAKNGVSFQGQVDGSLSPQDLYDLITFFQYARESGQIEGIQDARDIAASMGINSPAEVDMAYKLSKAQGEGATGFKKSEVSAETLKTADFARMSDEEYRDMGRQLVESGQVVPNQLVNDIINNPRALQPWEVTALQFYRTQIDSEMSNISSLIEQGSDQEISDYTFEITQGETVSGYKALAAQTDLLNSRLFDLQVTMLSTANQQSAAFRLRSLMSDKDFNIVSYLAEMKAIGYMNPELEARLVELSNELNEVKAKLRAREGVVDAEIDNIAEGNIKEDARRSARNSRVRTKKETVNTVNLVLDSIDVNSFGLPGMSFQTNGVVRFQVSPNSSVSQAVSDAISRMKDNVSSNTLSVSDAIEQAVSEIDSAVGEGNWDSMKFRSEITNQLVDHSVPVKSRRPYIDKSGSLIVPGEYIKELVRDGAETIDQMVDSVSEYLGGRYDAYDIRNAISGYGRQSGSKKTDLDRKISRAKRVARLLSQIQDLETKGKRLKTSRQKHNNDTEIKDLQDQVKRLEYELEMTPEERSQLAEQRYNEGRQKYLRNYVDQVQQRIDNRDFAPVRHVNRYEEDSETKALRAEAERIKNEFKKEKYRHELENRSDIEKWGDLAYEVVFNSTRAASAGADLSAIGVQGAIFSFARPREAYSVFKRSLGQMMTDEQYERYFAELQADPYYEMARKAGLNLQLPSFYQSVQEEQYKGDFPTMVIDSLILDPAAWVVAKAAGREVETTQEYARDRTNIFRLAERNYSLVLSQIRMNLFREFLNNQINKRGIDVKLDPDVVKQVANEVNTVTMASKVPLGQSKVGSKILSSVFFSARKLVSTWKILGGGMHLLVGPNRNPQLFKDAYGSVVGRGLGVMFLTSLIPTAIGGMMKYMSDDEEEPYFYNPYFFNPKHSDFLKIKLGDTRISLFQGIDGNAVFLTRFISKEYMTTTSDATKQLNGVGGNKSRGGLFWDYTRNKFAPTTSMAVGYFLGSDRESQETVDRFSESLVPMWASGIREQYDKTQNLYETSALAAMGMFGLAYNNYGGAEFANYEGTGNRRAQKIFDDSGLSAYNPANGQRSYFDGEYIVNVTGGVYEDQYLPAYQEYMTEAVVSHEDKLGKSVNWEIKEGLVDQMKREAYKYAEIKTSGVYATNSNFAKFSDNGTQYRILKSQYPLKVRYINQYMSREARRDRGSAIREVSRKMRSDGIKSTEGYRNMLVDLYLYKEANKYANRMLARDARRGSINLVKQSEYYSDLENEDE